MYNRQNLDIHKISFHDALSNVWKIVWDLSCTNINNVILKIRIKTMKLKIRPMAYTTFLYNARTRGLTGRVAIIVYLWCKLN